MSGTLSLEILSPTEAAIVRTVDGEAFARYPLKGGDAAGVIEMYEHLRVCPKGGAAFAETYLTGVVAGIYHAEGVRAEREIAAIRERLREREE